MKLPILQVIIIFLGILFQIACMSVQTDIYSRWSR